MLTYLYVACGGALGTVARFALSGYIANRFGETFPWGTLIINVTGSFVIGLFAALTSPDEGRWVVGGAGRQFFMIGICGGYTTFSSFSLQTLTLAQNREWLPAAGNIFGSVILCLVAVWLGYAAGAAINLRKGS